MADKDLTALSSVGALGGTELFYVVDADGNSRKLTLADLKTFINTDPTVVPSSQPWRGCRAYRTSNTTGVTTGSAISWNASTLDTDSIWSSGAASRLTVPSGVTKVRLFWSVAYEALLTAGSVFARPQKNGAAFGTTEHYGSDIGRQGTTGFNDNTSHGFSGVLSVVGGDYFELLAIFSMTGQDQIISERRTWFEMEIIEASV